MNFHPNSTLLFILAGAVIVFVIAQSLFFLIRAFRRGKELGMDMKQLKRTVLSTALFTMAPAVSILLGVITLSKFLGLPLPWLRLSIIGAITYELPAATSTANAFGISLSETVTDPSVYTAIAWVMTLGIFPGLIWVPLFIKKIQGGLGPLQYRISCKKQRRPCFDAASPYNCRRAGTGHHGCGKPSVPKAADKAGPGNARYPRASFFLCL